MLQGYELKFNIYAESQQEVTEAEKAIIAFISSHAQQGRAVTARKLAEAVNSWEKMPIVRNSIIKYFE